MSRRAYQIMLCFMSRCTQRSSRKSTQVSFKACTGRPRRCVASNRQDLHTS